MATVASSEGAALIGRGCDASITCRLPLGRLPLARDGLSHVGHVERTRAWPRPTPLQKYCQSENMVLLLLLMCEAIPCNKCCSPQSHTAQILRLRTYFFLNQSFEDAPSCNSHQHSNVFRSPTGSRIMTRCWTTPQIASPARSRFHTRKTGI